MNNKVYIVTSGEYSDYHICAVFKTYKEADKYCQYMRLTDRYEDPTIETYDLEEKIEIEYDSPIAYKAIFQGTNMYSLQTGSIYEDREAKTSVQVFDEEGSIWTHVCGSVIPRQGEDPTALMDRIKKVAIDNFYYYCAKLRGIA